MYNSENSEEAAYAIANKHFENAQKIVKDYLEGIKQKYEFFASNYGVCNLKSNYQI